MAREALDHHAHLGVPSRRRTAIMKSPRSNTATEQQAAIRRALEIGPGAASRELGIPSGTLEPQPTVDEEPSPTQDVEPTPEAPPTAETPSKRRVARLYTPSEKARALERAAEVGVTAASRELGVTRFSIYAGLARPYRWLGCTRCRLPERVVVDGAGPASRQIAVGELGRSDLDRPRAARSPEGMGGRHHRHPRRGECLEHRGGVGREPLPLVRSGRGPGIELAV